jgi:autotransporter family porin
MLRRVLLIGVTTGAVLASGAFGATAAGPSQPLPPPDVVGVAGVDGNGVVALDTQQRRAAAKARRAWKLRQAARTRLSIPSRPPRTVVVPTTDTPTPGATTPAPEPTSTTTPAPTQTPEAPPPPAPPSTAIDLTRTLPPGSTLPSSQACAAAVVRSPWEPRPDNADENATTPPANWVQHRFEGFASEAQTEIVPRVKGDFTGTTDEILQWGACKWGFDVDDVRAQAVAESTWRMSMNGDAGASWGILQVKPSAHPGTWPWARDSTAYNVDYTLARRRGCYEGWSYEGSASRGDLWGCIGMWFSGSYGSGYDGYVASVQRSYREKPWRSW